MSTFEISFCFALTRLRLQVNLDACFLTSPFSTVRRDVWDFLNMREIISNTQSCHTFSSLWDKDLWIHSATVLLEDIGEIKFSTKEVNPPSPKEESLKFLKKNHVCTLCETKSSEDELIKHLITEASICKTCYEQHIE